MLDFGLIMVLVLLAAWFLAALLVCWILDCAGREPLMTREEADRLREAVRAALRDQERRNVLMVVKADGGRTVADRGGKLRFYHGGPAGLDGMILPPSVTGFAESTADLAERHGWKKVARRDRVYVVTKLEAAVMYAAAQSRPAIYEVVPEGDLMPDPDCSELGLSFECPRARIVREFPPNPAMLRSFRQYFRRLAI